MLPQLTKKKSVDANLDSQNSHPRFNAGQYDPVQNNKHVKSNSAKKVRTGGGFMKTNLIQQQLSKPMPASQIVQQDNYNKFVKIRRNQDLSAEIKLIQRKIKACQRKIQQDKRKQKQIAQQSTKQKDRPDYDFQKVVQRQIQMQGYRGTAQQNNQNFDYLTNPKLNPHQEQEQQIPQVKPLIVQQKSYDISAGVEKLEKFYENSLKKKFERRQMFPHQACRRKTPKLYITQKTNALSKYGRAQNEAEHMFRVLTKQVTPQQIYPTIPNFAVVKDSLSRNIVAYLGDYRPFLEKTKQGSLTNNGKIDQNDKQQMQSQQNKKEDRTQSRKLKQINIQPGENITRNAKSKTRQSAVSNGHA